MESKRLAKCMLNYIRRHHDLVEPLFDLLDICTVRTRVDLSFLRDFLSITVAETYSFDERKQLLAYFIEAFRERKRSQEQLVCAAKLLIRPMLAASYERGEAVVDKDVLDIMIQHMFEPPEELASMPLAFLSNHINVYLYVRVAEVGA